MRVRLVRKLADLLDGVDVSGHRSGDILELSRHDAELLIAERWAEPEAGATREGGYARRAEDRARAEVDRAVTSGEPLAAPAEAAARPEVPQPSDTSRERSGTEHDDRPR
jgi:hypothetical protein